MTTKLARPANESDFRGAPEEVTTIPMFMDEDGLVYAYGHQHEDRMVEGIYALHEYFEILEEGLVVSTQDVRQGHARIIVPKDFEGEVYNFDDDDIRFMICSSNEEDAFPLTYWKP